MGSSKKRFNGFTEDTINFLYELGLNNNKTWFELNKERFINQVKDLFYDLVLDLNPTMAKIDPQLEIRPDKVLSRIYRDTRFSRDKSPYKTTMWITYKRVDKDWQEHPGYFFELSYNSYRYGMGFYSAAKRIMDLFRAKISKNSDQFKNGFNKIIDEHKFVIEGEIYKKKIPNDLPEEFQTWYQRSNIYLVCNRKIDNDLFSNKIVINLQKGFEVLKPLYYFFHNN